MPSVKDVEKEFRALGASRAGRDRHGTSWLFPDGAEKLLPRNTSPATLRSLVGWARDRYGNVHRPAFDGHKVRGPKPTIDLEQCTASTHAKERLALMRDQQGVTFEEVLLALRAPSSVQYSDLHGSWLWVRDRIAVAAFVNAHGHATISTLLWATPELWDASPRPEKANRS